MKQALGIGFATLALLVPQTAFAEDEGTLGILLPKLATSAIRFEALVKQASFSVSGKMESVGGDGSVSDTKEGSFNIIYDGLHFKVDVLKYSEDGADKTDEMKKKTEEKYKERKGKPLKSDEEVHMPFLASEQPKYDFHLAESDPRDPSHVKITFSPKTPAQNLFTGSVWVDSNTGDFLSAGFVPSKTPMFVDYVRVTIEFGETTSLGRAVSKINFEAGGGLLFIRKRVRGSAVLSNYSLPQNVRTN